MTSIPAPEAAVAAAPAATKVLSQEDIRELSLGNFTGPFDLLLGLVRKRQIDVMDIELSVITADYLRCLEIMSGELSLEVSGDFLSMAATLVYLKSRRLLPNDTKPDDEHDDPEMPQSEEELLRRLAEFERYQLASEELWNQPVLGRDTFTRAANQTVATGKAALPTNVIRLAEAYQRLVRKQEPTVLQERPIRSITVHDAVRRVVAALVDRERNIPFTGLVHHGDRRADIVALFTALLEMARWGYVRLEQNVLRGDALRVHPAELPDEDELEAFLSRVAA